jgi:hypothetical protein
MLLPHPVILRAWARAASLARVSDDIRQQSLELTRNNGRLGTSGSEASASAAGSNSFDGCRCKLLTSGMRKNCLQAAKMLMKAKLRNKKQVGGEVDVSRKV